jgi:hypothetical protein
MKQIISIDLTTRTTSWTPPEITFGESLTLGVRFTKNVDGTDVEPSLTVNSMQASVGRKDARPEGGRWKLQIGSGARSEANTTVDLAADETASSLAAKLNALTGIGTVGAARVIATDGSWLLFFGDQAERVELTGVDNGLWPVSFVRVSAWQLDGKWVHEIRLVQAPAAFTSSHDILLPPAPVISRIQEGGSDADVAWNEIQQLAIPPTFRGAYLLKKGFARTVLLSPEDGPQQIETALAALGDGFTVTLPLSFKPTIEFTGDFAGAAQDLIEVVVEQAPAGDLTFTLDFDKKPLESMLRRALSVTLPLEIKIAVTEEDVTGYVVPLTIPITIVRPLNFPELAEVPAVDWLRQPSPKNYKPFVSSNTVTGHQFNRFVGPEDEGQTTMVCAHGSETEDVLVEVRENTSGGRILVRGTDYEATVDDANQVTITSLVGALAVDQWSVIVVSAQTVEAFAEGLHITIAQVDSLQTILDDLAGRLGVLEEILPGTGPAATPDSATGMEIDLFEHSEILFAQGVLEDALSDRPPYMLPAVHEADSSTALPDPLPAPSAGDVWTAGARTLIPGGGHIRSSYVAADGFVASDGRINYPASRSGTSTSYYPAPFERVLWMFPINSDQLAVKRTLDVRFALALKLLKATCAAQWVLVIEQGAFTADATPATTGLNLKNIEWDVDVPILSQQLDLGPLEVLHPFGCRIYRDTSVLTCDKMKYGVWSGANSAAPDTANFALRARLINWDTENNDPNARGWVKYALKKDPGSDHGCKALIS